MKAKWPPASLVAWPAILPSGLSRCSLTPASGRLSASLAWPSARPAAGGGRLPARGLRDRRIDRGGGAEADDGGDDEMANQPARRLRAAGPANQEKNHL